MNNTGKAARQKGQTKAATLPPCPCGGRPSIRTPETADRICGALMDGRSLRAICDDPDMPDEATVVRWIAADEGFRKSYACARELQAQLYADEIMEIADEDPRCFTDARVGEGSPPDG